MPCIALCSPNSLGVCMLERGHSLRQVTLVTYRAGDCPVLGPTHLSPLAVKNWAGRKSTTRDHRSPGSLHAIVCEREFFEKGYFDARGLETIVFQWDTGYALRTRGGMRRWTLFVRVGVERGDAGCTVSRGIDQVFVTFQPNGYANLRFAAI